MSNEPKHIRATAREEKLPGKVPNRAGPQEVPLQRTKAPSKVPTNAGFQPGSGGSGTQGGQEQGSGQQGSGSGE